MSSRGTGPDEEEKELYREWDKEREQEGETREGPPGAYTGGVGRGAASSGSSDDDNEFPDSKPNEENLYYVCMICAAQSWYRRNVSQMKIEGLEDAPEVFLICRSCRDSLIEHIKERRHEVGYYKTLYQRLMEKEEKERKKQRKQEEEKAEQEGTDANG